MMKAATYEKYGPPEVLHVQQVAKPTPKDNEVLIKVHATSVTTGDCNARGFVFIPPGFKVLAPLMFGLRKPRQPILGVEVAGEVEAVGADVTRFQPGEQVAGIDGNGLGAYAEYKVMREDASLVHKPANLNYEEAATMSNGALTALTFLKRMVDVQAGQRVLIVGASGSVGSAAVQIAQCYGAHVTGVCSTTNVELVKSLGADAVIDYTEEDFTERGKTYDIIFDTVGKTQFSTCKRVLNPRGFYLAGAGGLREMGQMLWTSIAGSKKVKAGASSESLEDLAVIKELFEEGKLKPIIDRCYPLEQIVDAHRYVDTGRKKGNVAITVGNGG